jgi:hypothetical protein
MTWEVDEELRILKMTIMTHFKVSSKYLPDINLEFRCGFLGYDTM